MIRRSLVVLATVAGALGAQSRDSMVVSTAWLADHLNDPNIVVLHVSSMRRDYTEGHIPGARFIWTDSYAPNTPDLATELPPVARLDSVLESLGVSDKSRIILYGGPSVTTMTTRLYLTLDYLGASSRTSMLDGGLTAWKAENRPTTTETPSVKRGSFTPHVNPAVVANAEIVKGMIEQPGMRIIDARAQTFYNGQGGGQPRPGHIPSALNIPFNSVFTDDGHLKDRATLADIFKTAGVSSGDKVVTYCHVGQQATVVYFIARYLGYDAKMYDGSFQDWSGRSDLPLVGPAAKP
jgi:thiosulfate/3-mercaptopyruvate sulfurtransferase